LLLGSFQDDLSSDAAAFYERVSLACFFHGQDGIEFDSKTAGVDEFAELAEPVLIGSHEKSLNTQVTLFGFGKIGFVSGGPDGNEHTAAAEGHHGPPDVRAADEIDNDVDVAEMRREISSGVVDGFVDAK
jgi:hypothetical protein